MQILPVLEEFFIFRQEPSSSDLNHAHPSLPEPPLIEDMLQLLQMTQDLWIGEGWMIDSAAPSRDPV